MENRFNEILKKEAKSKKRTGDIRTYEDLIYGRFKLDKTVIIEPQDDKDSISNKWADFTPETIDKLIREGENYEKTSTVRSFIDKFDDTGVKPVLMEYETFHSSQ